MAYTEPRLHNVAQWKGQIWQVRHEGAPVLNEIDIHIACEAAQWGYQQCQAEYDRAACEIVNPLDFGDSLIDPDSEDS
jgi:hypothetical protein